jgi:ATP-dependent DNA ligase
MKTLEILNQIAAHPGRNDKIAILQKHKDNKELREFFYMSLDPLVTYGIKKIPQHKHSDVARSLWDNMMLLNKLICREATGNAGIDLLSEILGTSDEDDAEVIRRIIEKDPKCGVAESSVNKVWDKLIFDFPVMKANPYDEKTIANIQFPAYSQTKLDGARCALVCRDGKVTALSSSGREIEVHNQFDWCSYHFDGYVVDGELLVVEPSGKFMERKKGNGIVNRAVKGTIPVEQAKQLIFVAFDCIEYDVWSGKYLCTETYRDRLTRLTQKQLRHNMSVVETLVVESEGEAVRHFKHLMVLGEEGTILKNMDSFWEGKRSKDCVKFKGIISCDLVVTGVEEGTGKFAGKLGNLICESADGLVKVNVGSGFTDAEREMNMNFWLQRVVEVVYNERIKGKTEDAKWSLFLPRFGRVRIDKNVADTIDNIPLK